VAPSRECRAVVAATRALTPDILEADLRMDDPPVLAFAAGQWISVPFGPKTVRAYSIASTPRTPSIVTLSADVAPAGLGSAWFRGLAPGADVRFKGPLGGFVFDRTDTRRPLFVAEEIGIVPIRAMLLDLDETGFDRPATLVYWVRDPSWLVYDEDFRSLARRASTFSYRPVAGSSLTDAVTAAAPTVDGLVAYVAGGAQTINATREVLMARGLDRKSVKWEKFYG
jgi:propane monooxygenase reductase subunit